MKLFTQVALVSAIAVSGSAFAMQPMTDSALGQTTGQDGISLRIKPPKKDFNAVAGTTGLFSLSGGQAGTIAIDQLIIHDKDGLAPGGTKVSAGAIVIDGLYIGGTSLIGVEIDTDGGPTATPAPLLNVNVSLPADLTVRVGNISLAASNRDGVTASDITTRGVKAAGKVKILDAMTLKLGGATMDIQLGNETQGGMIKLGGTLTGGLTIDNFALNDNGGSATTSITPATFDMGDHGGQILVTKLAVTDNGSANLTIKSAVDVSENGLIMTMDALSPKTDILMNDVVLGNKAAVAGTNWDSTKAIGDVEIVGLDMAGTKIAIFGH